MATKFPKETTATSKKKKWNETKHTQCDYDCGVAVTICVRTKFGSLLVVIIIVDEFHLFHACNVIVTAIEFIHTHKHTSTHIESEREWEWIYFCCW